MKPTLITPQNTARMDLIQLLEHTAQHDRPVAWLEDWTGMTVVPSLISRAMPRAAAFEEWRFWYAQRALTGYTPVLSASPEEPDSRTPAEANATLHAQLRAERAAAPGADPTLQHDYAQALMAWANAEADRLRPDDATPPALTDAVALEPPPRWHSPDERDAAWADWIARREQDTLDASQEYAHALPLDPSATERPQDWVLSNLATFWNSLSQSADLAQARRAQEIQHQLRQLTRRADLTGHTPSSAPNLSSALAQRAPSITPRFTQPEATDEQYPHAELILVACPPAQLPLYTCLSPRVTSRGPSAVQLAQTLTAWRTRHDVELIFIGLRHLELLASTTLHTLDDITRCALDLHTFCPQADLSWEALEQPFWSFVW